MTILFADVVGSTALGERLAPEETKALVGECVTIMSRAVEEYGGTVQAYQGDGICAYFGVPVAHENDPERAALAGLRILELMGEYTRDIEKAWGIAGFSVRVGSTADAPLSDSSARPTLRLWLSVTRRTSLRACNRRPSQGRSSSGNPRPDGSHIASCSSRSATSPSRAEMRPSRSPGCSSRGAGDPAPTLPCIGREREIAELRSWSTISSRAGDESSSWPARPGSARRASSPSSRSLAGERATWLEGHCLSYGGLPPWPFMEILLGWLAAEAGEPEIAVRTKARARLGALLGEELDEVLSSLGQLLRLRPEHFADAGENGGIPRAYLRWLEALAAEQPVIVVLEDVQWADVPTRELAEAVLELTDRAGLALVLTDEPIAGSEGRSSDCVRSPTTRIGPRS